MLASCLIFLMKIFGDQLFLLPPPQKKMGKELSRHQEGNVWVYCIPIALDGAEEGLDNTLSCYF